jgi:hypothetical protein
VPIPFDRSSTLTPGQTSAPVGRGRDMPGFRPLRHSAEGRSRCPLCLLEERLDPGWEEPTRLNANRFVARWRANVA